jgi:large subunit ribosomal protein L29
MPTAREIREYDQGELESRIEESRKELFNLRFQAATGRLDNSARVGIVKREIARLLTVQREREIAEAEALEARRSEEK